MIGTIIGAVLGFLAAVLPAIFGAVGEYFEHRKDMDNGQQQIAAATAGVSVPVKTGYLAPATPTVAGDHVHDSSDSDDEADLDAGKVKPLFVRVFATLRAGVRPLITYGFFILFVFLKVVGMNHGYYVDHTPAVLLLPILWDEGTQALFAAVLAFWFGSRAIEKQQEAKIAAAGKASAGNNP